MTATDPTLCFAETPRYRLILAHDDAQLLAAQRLRYRVFAGEWGARLKTRKPGLDHDLFDPFCHHLLVLDKSDDSVVGCYRLLPSRSARVVGERCAEAEYDLTRIKRLDFVELSRACIAPEHRTGAVIGLLFRGLAAYLARFRVRYLFGLASFPYHCGLDAVLAQYRTLRQKYEAPIEFHVTPWRRIEPMPLDGVEPAPCPSLILAYLAAGAWIAGDPTIDPDFHCVDFPVLLDGERLAPRYRRHFSRNALRSESLSHA
ncbi:MAG: GNAT family N-acetyltransferase [Hydrogenophilus thermoluteolus]|uniref:GNAT family N-acetyltransferase n=1 Tax=Hydrogenophilus thermoluteolus TaxID=297 RepID=UPI000EBC127A|nr:GNAT family N-acyltransferase [Hydrogenophilus thermoluteolus]MBW7657700.1 GNAT family N-acetyltransferase [Hydrogenophilus thermoluteolus]HCO78003.1 GNAT family N-acetyltransferase [Rhodocyclaceae bacterium]HNQ49178.1 GNAT family N-acyltransferase [Hydrogenophilus thermoluteolus]HNU18693.1 GNAT family N-acyltransferase [Hydrogenophilus thermoluteolus]